MSDRQPHLRGRVILSGEILARTGLHIGGNDTGLDIGGVDKVVVRDSLLDGRPYIPGSSLKGKLRSLTERAGGYPQEHLAKGKKDEARMDVIKMHSCHGQAAYDLCPVCKLYGVPSNWDDKDGAPFPTRLIVRDAPLTYPVKEDKFKHTTLPYTEVKTEVAIDRLTSAANPRQFERVPAGSRFALELVVNLYQEGDAELLNALLFGLGLLEGDYLGGQGSRGYGQVRLTKLEVKEEWFVAEPLELPDWRAKLPLKKEDGTSLLADLNWTAYAPAASFKAPAAAGPGQA